MTVLILFGYKEDGHFTQQGYKAFAEDDAAGAAKFVAEKASYGLDFFIYNVSDDDAELVYPQETSNA